MSIKYKTILWDWNGTLLDDVSLAIRVMNRMLADYGHPQLTADVYAQVFDFPVQTYYERIGFDLQSHDFSTLSDRFCSEFESGLADAMLFSATATTLAGLGESQHFVLSNTEQTALDRMLARFQIEHLFEAVYGLSHNHATGKLSIGHELLKTHGVDRRTAILIGDTLHDAEVALGLGIDCALVATGHNSRARLEAVDVPVMGSLAEIQQYLSRVD